MTARRMHPTTQARLPSRSRLAAQLLVSYGILFAIYWCTSPGTGASLGLSMVAAVALAILYSVLWLLFQFSRTVGWYIILVVGLAGFGLSVAATNAVAALMHLAVVSLLISDRPSTWTHWPAKWVFGGHFVEALMGQADEDRVRGAIAWGIVILALSMGLLLLWRHLYVAGRASDLSGRYYLCDYDTESFWSRDSRALYYFDSDSEGHSTMVRFSLRTKAKQVIRLPRSPQDFYDCKGALSPDGRSAALVSGPVMLVDLRSGKSMAIPTRGHHYDIPFWLSEDRIGLLGEGLAVYDVRTRALTQLSRHKAEYGAVVAVDGAGFVDKAQNGGRVAYYDASNGHKVATWEGAGRITFVTNRYFIAQQYDTHDLRVVDMRNPRRRPLIIRSCPPMHALSPDLRWYTYAEGGVGEWTNHALYVGVAPSRIRRSIARYLDEKD